MMPYILMCEQFQQIIYRERGQPLDTIGEVICRNRSRRGSEGKERERAGKGKMIRRVESRSRRGIGQ